MYMQNLADEVWDYISASCGVLSDPLAGGADLVWVRSGQPEALPRIPSRNEPAGLVTDSLARAGLWL